MDLADSIRRLYELVNAKDLDGFARHFADDFVEHEVVPGFAPTKAGVMEYFHSLLATFPDLRMIPEDVITSGDKAVARLRVTGTQQGVFMGVPATGRRVDVPLIDIIRFGDDGRAREHWGLIDQLALLQQLGVIPAKLPGV